MPKDIHTEGIPVLCSSCKARQQGICGSLDPVHLVSLARFSNRKLAERGTELAGTVEQVDRYSNILSGVVKLTKTLPDGRQQIVALQFAPDFLGRPFSHVSQLNVEAATEVSVCSFPKHVIEQMLRESPKLERRLYQQALRELDEARDWMVALGRKTAGEKVACFILMIAHNIDPDHAAQGGSLQFNLPLTRSEIADFLGLTLETVSRQFSHLRNENIIQIENNQQITVPDLDRLRERDGN